MVRTQIQLTEDQHRKLRHAARREGVSLAEMVRRCVVRYFREETPAKDELYARAASAIGRFSDQEGRTDVAERHDEYLDEAYS